ncbi:MAG: hypothetical protein HRU20_32185, partial [Pseudomonadales bacterium]|nr:hypothetical protein [Pseudomonadales bacterium]
MSALNPSRLQYTMVLLFGLLAADFSIAAISATSLDFSNGPGEQSDFSVGDAATWTDVATVNGQKVDMVVTMTALSGGTGHSLTTANGNVELWLTTANTTAELEYRFIDPSDGGPVIIYPEVFFGDLDKDSNNDERIVLNGASLASYILESPSRLSVDYDSLSDEYRVSSTRNGEPVDSDIALWVKFKPASVFTVIYTVVTLDRSRRFAFDASVSSGFFNKPVTVMIDNDAPVNPTVTELVSDNGLPVISGTAEAYSEVTVIVNGSSYTLAPTSTNDVSWSVDLN